MTERQTTNKNLGEKLEVLLEKVTRIEEQLLSQPKIDKEKEKNITQKFETHEERIKNLESNQKWVVIAILGIVINAVMQLVLH